MKITKALALLALVLTACLVPVVGAADPCVINNVTPGGVVILPPVGCQYLSPDEVHAIVDGLPPGTTIELSAFHKDFLCGREPGLPPQPPIPGVDCFDTGVPPGPGQTEEVFASTVSFRLKGTGALAGWERDISIPNVICRVGADAQTPGAPVRSLATSMEYLQGQIGGDPDFDLLRIIAGGGNGLPSPGHTTLTQLPGGNWQVDSFFDITYRIDFVGAPGGHLAGFSGSTTATIRMTAAAPTSAPIPTVSEWGLIILGLLMLAVATLAFRRLRTQNRVAAA